MARMTEAQLEELWESAKAEADVEPKVIFAVIDEVRRLRDLLVTCAGLWAASGRRPGDADEAIDAEVSASLMERIAVSGVETADREKEPNDDMEPWKAPAPGDWTPNLVVREPGPFAFQPQRQPMGAGAPGHEVATLRVELESPCAECVAALRAEGERLLGTMGAMALRHGHGVASTTDG